VVRPVVVLDRQHAGKPGSKDQGAVFADGTTEAGHALRYIEAAVPLLEHSEVDVHVITSGSYPDRNKFGNSVRCALYVACHVNAGGGEYALTEHSIDSGPVKSSAAAAMALLRASDDELGQKAVGPWPLKSGQRGHVCIGACTGPAVIYEPYFVEHPRLDAPDVARSLARGVCAFVGRPFKEIPTVPEPTNIIAAWPAPEGGVWTIDDRGGVHARDGAPFFGSYSEDVAAGRAVDHPDRRFVAICAHGAGYQLVSKWNERYKYPPRS
jgi:hypothetical protein